MKKIALFAASLSFHAAPAFAIDFQTGDRACLGYDAATGSCLSIQEVEAASDGKVTVLDRTLLKLGTKPLTLLSRASMQRRGEGYCMVEGSLDYSAQPVTHTFAKAMPGMLSKQMGTMARLGLCMTHRMCGDTLVVDSNVGGVARPSMRQTFRLFRKGDPAGEALTSRPTTVAQMQRVGQMVPEGCTATGA